MRIAIASDHGGFELKEKLVAYLEEKGIEVRDFGCNSLESVDYPSYGFKIGEVVSDDSFDRGIVICGTGIGISIAANKVKGIRCALCHNVFTAEATRLHNDSNVLALGGRIVNEELAKEIVDVWLNTEYEGGRHDRRINKLKEYEEYNG